jgi:L-asparaginase
MTPSILVLSLGGTIAMVGDAGAGVVPALDAADLVGAVPRLAEVAAVKALAFRRLPGASLSLDDLTAAATVLGDELAGDVAGAVVVQGTDTIEETAFLLDLLLAGDKPVVVTGAMRPPQEPGADGPANLLSAVTVAASNSARGQGVVVVLNDEIHAARFVQKRHSSKPSAFASPAAGPIGIVAEGQVRLQAHTWPLPKLPLDPGQPLPPVAIVKTSLGDDGRLLRQVLPAGYRGLVLEAMGAGHVPASMAPLVAKIAGEIPVILTSRTGAGPTFTTTYGFDGSERDLLGRGAVSGGGLCSLKSRLLLSVLLARGAATDEVAAMFEAYGGGPGLD